MNPPPPRHYLRADTVAGAWPPADLALPQDKLARVEARRAFVTMKQRFIDAVANVDGSRGDWLRHQVRQTQEPVDLWLLRGAVFSALRAGGRTTHPLRLDLHRALDSVFPDAGEPTPFMPL
jgi:hypothetical protein